MRVPQTDREDCDRPSRVRESRASLQRWFPRATLASAYEAGFSAFVLHRALTKVGISNIVVNPASLTVLGLYQFTQRLAAVCH
jgi:hypothetical protein